jgi:hypothetical protein
VTLQSPSACHASSLACHASSPACHASILTKKRKEAQVSAENGRSLIDGATEEIAVGLIVSFPCFFFFSVPEKIL